MVRQRNEKHETLKIIHLLQVVPVHSRPLSPLSATPTYLDLDLFLAVLWMCNAVAMEMLPSMPHAVSSSLHLFISLQCVLVRSHSTSQTPTPTFFFFLIEDIKHHTSSSHFATAPPPPNTHTLIERVLISYNQNNLY